MTRIAYKDEYPWHRCDCGWLICSTGLMAKECPGCGKIEASEHRNRFGPSVEYRGAIYIGVPYENYLDRRSLV